jgi:nitroreductase
MDLIETLRSSGAVREFTGEPVSDEVVARILDNARFAPSGANAQAWHVVLVKSAALRAELRDLYLPGWRDYLAATPVAVTAAAAQGFAGELDRVPVLLVVFADLSALAAVDRDAQRYSFAGGASVYPFVWSILLAARAEGLGGVLTTMLIRAEDAVRRLLGAPENWAVAAVLALGHPIRAPRRLRRRAVSSFTTVDRIDGAALHDPPKPSGNPSAAT